MRSVSEIYNALVAEKESMSSLAELQPGQDNAQTLLNDLTSSSKVAEWRLWLWVIAFSQWLLEGILDQTKKDVEALAMASKSHNLRWYSSIAKKYQHGHDLEWDDNEEQFKYDTVDEDVQIVKRAATSQVDNVILLKVAKDDEKLSPVELTAFKAYIQEVKDAGSRMIVISEDADQLKLSIDVYYDPLVLSSAGESLVSPGTFPVQDQVNAYLDELPFNGEANIVALTDSLQLGTGILQPVVKQLWAQKVGEGYVAFDAIHVPYSGWFEFDLANSNINYIPRND